jgi:multiple sugar transport system permease protein
MMDGTTAAIARRRRLARTTAVYAALTIFGALFLLPFLWMLSTSVKPNDQVFVYPPQWIPNPVLWANYVDAMTAVPFLLYVRNTVFISGVTILGTLVSCSLVAYGFSRVRWIGRDAVFVIVLATMMLPTATTLVPLYVIFRKLGWMGTFNPLIVPPFFGTAFFIFLLRQFFRTLPMELDEAARIDGASPWVILTQIILPLSRPAIAVVTVFSFLSHWNDFFGPLVYLTSEDKWTLALGISALQGLQWGRDMTHLVMAVSVIMVAPVVVLFFLAQKTFIRGIVLTGLKA